MNQKKNETSILYIGLGIFLIIAYQIILPGIYFSIFKNFATHSNFWISNLTYLGYYLLIIAGLIILFRKRLKKEWKEFLKNWKTIIKTGLNCWAKGIGLMVISNIIVLSITGNMAANEAQNREILTALPLYAISIMCLIGPMIEELVFRFSFKKGFKNKYIFAIVTSLIFASLHVVNSFDPFTIQNIMANWKQLLFLLPYSSLAIFFALGYYETDNIFTSAVAHIFHNTCSVIIILLFSI